MRTAFSIAPFAPADALVVADLWQQAFGGREDEFPGSADALARGPLVTAQTGHRILVARDRDGIAGAVRWADVEGVASFDLLVSAVAGAGRALVRGVERAAQDLGIRLVRCYAPPGAAFERYFLSLGYLPAGRDRANVLFERRLPLLTVREQRRTDAADIARLAGEDPWPFEQGHRPGWFVLADGDRVVGAVSMRLARDLAAEVVIHAVEPLYRDRGLELWMLDRLAFEAETNGALFAWTIATPDLARYGRDLESRRWHLEGHRYVRRLGHP